MGKTRQTPRIEFDVDVVRMQAARDVPPIPECTGCVDVSIGASCKVGSAADSSYIEAVHS